MSRAPWFLEDYAGKGSRRCERVARQIDEISGLAEKRKINVRRFSRADVKRAFVAADAKTKYKVALAIAKSFPELQPRLPRFRKPWMSEDYRMSIFDAVAFAMAYTSLRRSPQSYLNNGTGS